MQEVLLLAKENLCSLHLIDGDHRLNSSIDVVVRLFAQFLTSLALTSLVDFAPTS